MRFSVAGTADSIHLTLARVAVAQAASTVPTPTHPLDPHRVNGLNAHQSAWAGRAWGQATRIRVQPYSVQRLAQYVRDINTGKPPTYSKLNPRRLRRDAARAGRVRKRQYVELGPARCRGAATRTATPSLLLGPLRRDLHGPPQMPCSKIGNALIDQPRASVRSAAHTRFALESEAKQDQVRPATNHVPRVDAGREFGLH